MRARVQPRLLAATLALSAAAFVALVRQEGYTERAVIPVQGDVPTIGFGSTRHEDGRPVRLGETTTPVNALAKAHFHITQEEKRFRASLPGVYLTQAEYDLYMDWVYQYGSAAWGRSSMRAQLLAGHPRAACEALLRYRFVAGYDCATPGNRRCPGVWARQQQRHAACLAAVAASASAPASGAGKKDQP